MRQRIFFFSILLASQILFLPSVTASETGHVGAYNVKEQNTSQTPPCSPAAGDGSTNDTVPIQCALNAAGTAGGGIVFLPQGTYRTSASLNVPSLVTLQGAGPGSTIKPLNGASIGTGVVMLANSSTPVTGATVRDLHIDGNGANLTVLFAGIALDYSASYNTITNVVIENVRAEGIGLYTSTANISNDYNQIVGNIVHDNGVGTSCGQIIVWAGKYNQILNNSVYKSGSARSGTAWGISLNVNNTSQFVRHNILRGNSVTNTGYDGIGASMLSCTGCTTQISWNEISGNKITDCANIGILLETGTGHHTVTSNTVTGNGGDGMLIKSAGNTISDNVVTDNSAGSPNQHGIRLYGSGATDNVVTGNVTQNVLTNGQQRGILEENGPDFNVIVGNNGRNNALSPGVIKAGTNTILANNLGQ